MCCKTEVISIIFFFFLDMVFLVCACQKYAKIHITKVNFPYDLDGEKRVRDLIKIKKKRMEQEIKFIQFSIDGNETLAPTQTPTCRYHTHYELRLLLDQWVEGLYFHISYIKQNHQANNDQALAILASIYISRLDNRFPYTIFEHKQ